MYCTKCGKQIPDGSKFCPYCGNRTDENVLEHIQQKVTEAVEEAEQRETLEQENLGSVNANNRKTAQVIINDSLTNALALIICAAAAVVYVPGIFNGFIGLFQNFFNLRLTMAALLNIRNILMLFLNLFALGSFALLAMKRRNSNTAELLGACVLSSLLVIVVGFVTMLLHNILFSRVFTYSLKLGWRYYTGLIASGALFAVFYLNGNKTLLNFDYSSPLDVLSDILSAFIDALNLGELGKKAEAREEQIRNEYVPKHEQQEYVHTGRRIKEDRSLLKFVLFNILTCGIYSFFFIHELAEDMNEMCDDDQPTAGIGKYILFSILTCGFYSLFWEYKVANRMAENAPKFGMSFTENGTTVLLWQIVGAVLCFIGPFIASNILITNANRLARAYNKTLQ